MEGFDIDVPNPIVSVAVASLRTGDPLIRLLESIRGATAKEYEVIIATPKIGTEIQERIEREHPARFVFDGNASGCVAAFNLAFSESRGKYICHANDDLVYLPNSIDIVLDAIGDRDVMGAFAFQEPDTNGQFLTRTIFGIDYANFGCIKKSLFEKLGYWDSRYTMYAADPDFGLKMKQAGYEVIPVPNAKIIHYCIWDENRKEHLRDAASSKLVEKWKGIFC
jgi:GT2 family glycosyltransferase